MVSGGSRHRRPAVVHQPRRSGIYKASINVVGEDTYNSSIEPVLAWNFGFLGMEKLNSYISCEVPLENNREDYTAKTGLAWVF